MFLVGRAGGACGWCLAGIVGGDGGVGGMSYVTSSGFLGVSGDVGGDSISSGMISSFM